jgi:bifunctional non-homologous end joining protein LigD
LPDRFRDGDGVRLFTRNGHDWSDRYPLIAEAARRIRTSQFVLDGEAVVLGVDGISDFDGLYGGKQNDEVQLYAFDKTLGAPKLLTLTLGPLDPDRP